MDMEAVKAFLGIGTSLSAYTLLVDFCIASICILIGQLLRAKVKIIQRAFLPAAMMAGFIGLFLGPKFLNVLPFSGFQGSYGAYLIIVIFTVVGLDGFDFGRGGKTENKEVAKRLVGFQMYRFATFFIQFSLPFIVTFLVIRVIWPEISDAFAVILPAGFMGGPGTAAAVGKTLADLGWAEGTDLGMTSATLGILTGIFGGMAWIKWATKRGVTSYVKDFDQIDRDTQTGLVSPENRTSIGSETINPVSLDTLCFHLCIVLATAGIGCLLNKVIAAKVISGIPDFTVSYLLGLALFMCLRKTKLYNYYDSQITNKISGTCTDYLVFFGIASINPAVVIKYAGPLAILILSGIVCCHLTMIPLGNRMIKETWFEHAIFVYGYCTGVFANSFILLRIVDPQFKSKTIEDIAITPFTSFLEIFCWSLVPTLLINGQGWWVAGVATVGMIVSILVSIKIGAWYNLPLAGRPAFGLESSEGANK